jgi:hypothetical protein
VSAPNYIGICRCYVSYRLDFVKRSLNFAPRFDAIAMCAPHRCTERSAHGAPEISVISGELIPVNMLIFK